MFENIFQKDDYSSILEHIASQQFTLLKRKARLLEDELEKTNIMIQNYSYKDNLSNTSTHFKNNKTKYSFKKNSTVNISKKHVLFLSSVFFILFSINLIDNHYSLFTDSSFDDNHLTSKFVIENLRGDTIDTMKSWKILPDDSLNINLLNGDTLTAEQYDAVNKVIMSTDSIELDDYLLNKGPMGFESTYYLGWAGAMNAAKQIDTVYTIPSNYNIFQSSNGEGDIVINFSNLIDTDGFSGYTRSVLEDGEILKSYITIYDVDSLEASELATILRHEFGHALGLGHSTDPEDLMAPAILTDFPYVSECNVDAMRVLYNGHESGMAVCKK